MKAFKQILYWLLVLILMALLFKSLLGSFLNGFMMALLSLPGALFMAMVFQYWKRERSGWRHLHLAYALIIGLYLEWLGMIIAIWLLFEWQISTLPEVTVNPIFLWLYMACFALLWDQLFPQKAQAGAKAERHLSIVSQRKQVQIALSRLRYIESRDELTYFHLEGEVLESRERIGRLAEDLQDDLLRIHRSFLINPTKVVRWENQKVYIGELELPISRSYRESALNALGARQA